MLLNELANALKMRLDEKNSENASLQRQLEAAITDLKRQKELEREHISLSVSRTNSSLKYAFKLLNLKKSCMKCLLLP